MNSLWMDERFSVDPAEQAVEPGARFDVVVVGAGLTGLATAQMLLDAGRSVAVVEARTPGAVTTGHSTAKLSLLHSGALAEIRHNTSPEVLRAYIDGNRQGQQWLLDYLHNAGVEVQRRDAFSYVSHPDASAEADAERTAALEAGLDVEDVTDLGLPFPTYSGLRLKDQAQFDPMHVVRALVRGVRRAGGVVIDRTRVTDVDIGDPCTVRTAAGDLIADRVVLATGVPFLDRGLYFAKVTAHRSYALAFRVPGGALPSGMYLSLDSPTRSLRTAPVHGEERLLVGGNGHLVGEGTPTRRNVEDLEAWTKEHFPGAVRTHAWSAQDYRSANRIPFVGWMPRAGGKVFLATGFNKWGMTNAVAAALSLTADLVDAPLPWAEKLHHRVTRPTAVGSGVAANARVAGRLASGWVGAELSPLPDGDPPEGSGVTGNERGAPVAVSTVDGAVCRLSAVCTHLGGILTWNDAERSWDCPLHGSRFDAQGRLLEGPATEDLRRMP